MDKEQKGGVQGPMSKGPGQRPAQSSNQTKNNNSNNPAISIPKGGGAVKGKDGDFRVDGKDV